METSQVSINRQWMMDKQGVEIHTMKYCSAIEGNDTPYDVDGPWKHEALWKKPDTKSPQSAWFHLYDLSQISKFIETESELVVAGMGEGGAWRMRSGASWYEFPFAGDENVWGTC